MPDPTPMDPCPPNEATRCQRHLDEIPALKRMLQDMHEAWTGDIRTGRPGMAETMRELARRVSDLEARTNRHSDKIHTLQTETIPGLVAAGGTTAKKAWWEVGKAALALALGAVGALFASGKPPTP